MNVGEIFAKSTSFWGLVECATYRSQGGDIIFSAPGCLPVSIAGIRPSPLVTMSLRVVLNRCMIVDYQRFEFVFSLRVPSDRGARVRVNGQLIQNAVDEFGRLFILARPFNSTPTLKLYKTGQTLVYDRARDVRIEYEGGDGRKRIVSLDGRPTAAIEQFRTIR